MVVFWSIEILGDKPSMESTSGFSTPPINCRAYADKLSTYLLCPSAKIVSKAKLLLPLPDTPVITISLFLGSSISTFFKLFSLAPFTIILSFINTNTSFFVNYSTTNL